MSQSPKPPAPARQDRTLSQITQIMYSYNLTVDELLGALSRALNG